MSAQMTRSGHFTGHTADVNLDLGFVPDYFELIALGASAAIIIYKWWRRMELDESSGAQEGISITEGITARLADSQGIVAYNSAVQRVRIPHPDGTRNKYTTGAPSEFTAGAAQPTARSTSVIGTLVWPSTRNGYVYECTASAGVLGTEPTSWPTVPGDTVSDGTNTWTCRKEDAVVGGYQGVTIASQIQTDGTEMYYRAEKNLEDLDHGDAASWPT